jgi:leader peptidase (prepilin peptidase)/N-methyltransferase
VFILSLCWGSFLNVIAHRIAFNKKIFTKRSICPHCHNIINWYDNIPLISFIFLYGKCRHCKKSISILYPVIELSTAVIITALFIKFLPSLTAQYINNINFDNLWNTSNPLFPVYNLSFYTPLQNWSSFILLIIFISALIISTRTDLEAMVIPRICTLWLIPVGLLASFFNILNINITYSFFGAITGYMTLKIIALLFKYFTKKEGMGEGDMEFLSMIGSFVGPIGVWFTLMLGSILGCIIGGLYLLIAKKERFTRIPFGPFLSIGTILFLFFEKTLAKLFLFT